MLHTGKIFYNYDGRPVFSIIIIILFLFYKE